MCEHRSSIVWLIWWNPRSLYLSEKFLLAPCNLTAYWSLNLLAKFPLTADIAVASLTYPLAMTPCDCRNRYVLVANAGMHETDIPIGCVPSVVYVGIAQPDNPIGCKCKNAPFWRPYWLWCAMWLKEKWGWWEVWNITSRIACAV